MLKIENINKDELSILNFKLQKDYDKLLKKLPKKQLNEKQELVVESLTLGNEKNDRVIMGSLAVPGIPFAIGVVKAAAGLVALIPSMGGAPTEEAVTFFEKAANFGHNTFGSGISTISSAVPLLAVPAGVVALSVSMNIYKKIQNKRIKDAQYTNAVVNLIDDVIAKKEDPSLEFINKFIGRVDLSENDQQVNLGLLKYMAYYRYLLKEKQEGRATEEEVNEAFDYIVLYIKLAKDSNKVSDKFKNNRFVNLLIFDYDEKMKEEKELLNNERVK